MKTASKPGFLLLALALFTAPLAQAATTRSAGSTASGPFGLGVILGDPTGFTGKYWTGPRGAVDFGLAFAFGDYFLLYGDYLYHFPGAFGASSEFARDLTPYVGIGGLIAFSTDDRTHHDRRAVFRDSDSSVGLGLRIPLGLEWKAPDVPIGVFVELVPGMSVAPNTDAFLEGGIGARYYF